ncbi:hypothetical protein [Nocardioides plantarum]|uniref:Uncharacterized protein n=1 Tax=Nocardioides plantarum TaxID=29299 RepID=A0ABV5K8V9_9ACTN|nr:hypothetical protein [Nocardioides plantarum]
MELHDTLYSLGQQWGRGVLDDPDRLRGLLAPTGASPDEVELVVDAVRRGAHRGLVQALDAGTDPARAIEATGDRLGQERGTDPAAARWVVAVLGFALGRVGEHDVRRQRGPGQAPYQAPGQAPGQAPYGQAPFGQPTYPPPAQPYQQAQPGQPAYAAGYPQQGYGQQPGWSPTPPKTSRLPILLGVGGTVLAIVVAVVLALVLTNGDDTDSADQRSDGSTSADASTDPTSDPTTDPSSDPSSDPVPTQDPTSETVDPAPDGKVSDEAAAGYTSALLTFSTAFGDGGKDLQAASTSDNPARARAAARKMRSAVKDLDVAVRGLDLAPVQTEVDAFLVESSRILRAYDKIDRTAKTTLDVNAGVAGLPITDYTNAFQAVADAIDKSRNGG